MHFKKGLIVALSVLTLASCGEQQKPDAKMVERAVDLMGKAKRPLFYVGGGVVNFEAIKAISFES